MLAVEEAALEKVVGSSMFEIVETERKMVLSSPLLVCQRTLCEWVIKDRKIQYAVRKKQMGEMWLIFDFVPSFCCRRQQSKATRRARRDAEREDRKRSRWKMMKGKKREAKAATVSSPAADRDDARNSSAHDDGNRPRQSSLSHRPMT